jgi:aldehyde dehydrogenase (NAD+)
MSLNPETRNLIGGRLVGAANGATFDNVNPATEEVIGVCADGTKDDMLAAIGAARRAFDETRWSVDHTFRQKCLAQLAAALADAKDDLREIVVAEAGSPLVLAYAVQCDGYIDAMPYWADMAASYEYERPMRDISFMGTPQTRLLRREATGVVGAITPWNFPLYLNLCKIGPALAAGNTVVLKPAPDTPWCATTLGRIIMEKTDIPAGVVNVVASADHRVGELLSSDPRVDLVTFTGSTATGRRVMECAAKTIKKVFLELGGKSASIVLEDANFVEVIPGIGTMCAHAGQGCALTTRLLLPRSRYEEGLALAKEAFEQIPYGDPLDPSHLMGPLISGKQRERVLGYIERGKKDGARLVTGGGVPAHLSKGFYVQPTIFADVDPASAIATEEIFGPVLVVIPYDDEDDAVRIANNSIYGLSGAVSSASEERALAVARRIRTGTMSVNGAIWFDIDTPFGGYRQSGLGRENGLLGFEEYLETKVIALPSRLA